ncbi:MAG: AAA domain-containing protein [Blastocatellia bacterium]
MTAGRPRIRVTEIGEFIRHNSCERRFKLEYNDRAESKKLPFSVRFFNSIDPVLEEAGRKHEEEWEQYLLRSGLKDTTAFASKPATASNNQKKTNWADFAAKVNALNLTEGQTAYGREIEVSGSIGAFDVRGVIDFVLILWRNGRPRLRLVESKASRRDRTYHRIQVTAYSMLVRQLLLAYPVVVNGITLTPDDMECVVVRIDESTNQGQAILEISSFDLETEQVDIELLLAQQGPFEAIVNTPIGDLSYQLEEKCDGCVFNIYCLPESGRERRLELLSLEPSTVRSLHNCGITNIDQLATLDLMSAQASQLRSIPTFTENLVQLRQMARSRSKTLAGGSVDPDTYPVEAFQHAGKGQVPSHIINGIPLVRIYLSVDYDYVENRIGALSAHVTKSQGQLQTDSDWDSQNKRWIYDSEVKERFVTGVDYTTKKPIYEKRALISHEVIEFKSSQWTGRYDEDTGSEREIIQGFLRKLIDVIAEVAATDFAPIHFYVWSKSEIARLIEACSRVGSGLLGHLRELLGCRDSLEQLIYSSLKDEVDHRYALGWTGRGLAVVSSLLWYGRRYHWVRKIAGRDVELDRIFEQDIFDFKTTLRLKSDNTWAKDGESATPYKFEIRSRFSDSLTAPYWRAYWGQLDASKPGIIPPVRSAIERYNQAAKPRHLEEYFRARVHALRWVEENIRFKNDEITKPLMNIAELQSFTLGVNDPARAAIDFLRLDRHVATTEWIAAHLVPPAARVPKGRTIPITNIRVTSPNRLLASIDLSGYDINYSALESRCGFVEGDFVRLTVSHADPHTGQTFSMLMRYGSNCIIDGVDWASRQIRLSVIPRKDASRYILQSADFRDQSRMKITHATIDESPSDFVRGHVDDRLSSRLGSHAYDWFNSQSPIVPAITPPTATMLATYDSLLQNLPVPPAGKNLQEDQRKAVVNGLTTKIQLLQGPPGTGKTTTSSVATLLRILAKRQVRDIVLIAANTHTAINTLLKKVDELLPDFSKYVMDNGLTMPPTKLSKVQSSSAYDPTSGNIEDFAADKAASTVKNLRKDAILIIGGTTGAILKMVRKLDISADFKHGFQVPLLILDEASMMVFPDFLALATLVQPDGEIMLTGDHRQLAPIVAHDWDREDRPPVVLYQPFVSAYEAVQRIKRNISVGTPIPDEAILLSSLCYTFRLPAEIRELISRLYRLDEIELQGPPMGNALPLVPGESVNAWQSVWEGETGLYLVSHNERESKQSNEIEVNIIERILDAGGERPSNSIAIVTPHRAQRTLLQTRLSRFSKSVDVIDTVERLQGGERPTVFVSGTASDPAAIGASAKFILDLNRSNVAFSRTQQRLIVVVSESLLNHIPVEYENYESTMLWKALRSICTELVADENIDSHIVRVLTLRREGLLAKLQEN